MKTKQLPSSVEEAEAIMGAFKCRGLDLIYGTEIYFDSPLLSVCLFLSECQIDAAKRLLSEWKERMSHQLSSTANTSPSGGGGQSIGFLDRNELAAAKMRLPATVAVDSEESWRICDLFRHVLCDFTA